VPIHNLGYDLLATIYAKAPYVMRSVGKKDYGVLKLVRFLQQLHAA
jgi:hypothetical protein